MPDTDLAKQTIPDRDRIARLVLDSADDFAIFTTDLEGMITSWSPGAEKLLGWTELEIIGGDACLIFTPEDLEAGACAAEMATARRDGRAEDERWHVRKDGSRLFASGLLMRLEEPESGCHIGYVKVLRDRTQRHQANEERLALHRQSAEILEGISDAFYALDGDWRFTYVNRKACEWWQRDRDEMIGKVIWEEYPEAVGSEAWQAHVDAMRDRRGASIETLSPTLGRWVAIDIHPTGEGGLSVYSRDLSARRAREAELRESEARLRLAVDAARMAIWERDFRSDQLKVTPELAAFLGISEEELADAEAVRARYGPGDAERLRDTAEAALARGERYVEAEFQFRRGDDWRWMLLRAELFVDEDGRPERVVGAIVDITDRRRAEEALRQLTDTLEDQVAQRTRELLQAEEALRQSQKMEAIGQLTGGVAHDFNNLLTIIRSSADLLRRPNVPAEKQQRYLSAIAETVDRAAKLTGQLLAFARRQALAPEVFDAAERIRQICEMIRTVAGATVELALDVDCRDCFVEADVGQFETAIVNLAVNARDAMEGRGRLAIAVARSEATVSIAVRDTGCGVAPDALPHLFEPFFTTKEVGKGTGLGLSQVYGFARQSGGDISVDSRPGAGAVFTLILPLAAPRLDGVDTPSAIAVDAQGSLRILLVEDNAQVGELAGQLFEELGHQPTLAADAAEALARLEQDSGDFDLVFSDVVMPGVTGIELGEEIRRRWPGLRVVLTSGYSHVLAEQGSHGFELVQKPYSVDTLRRVLAGRGGASA